MIAWNLISSKESYKRFSSLESIKNLINTLMISSLNNDNDNVSFKMYQSIFSDYSDFDEFLKKNLISFNSNKDESYITHNNLNINELYPNKKIIKQITTNEECNISNEINKNWKNYTSTLNFINDLINISEILRLVDIEHRNKVLSKFIKHMNSKILPSNAYLPVPFGFECLEHQNGLSNVLSISEEFAICLSTKEKVPFHICVELAENLEKNDKINSELDKSYTLSLYDDRSNYLNDLENIQNNYQISKDLNLNTSKNQPPTKSKLSFFANFFSCCQANHHIEEDESENSKFENEVTNIDDVIKSFKKDTQDFVVTGLFGKSSFQKESKRILENSKHNIYKNRKLVSIIVKGGEDMRQDQFVSQVIELFISIFEKESVDVFLKPLNIITNGRGGIVLTLTNTVSLQKIKTMNLTVKEEINSRSSYLYYLGLSNYKSSTVTQTHLKTYFINKFGRDTQKYAAALNNFIKSFAGYSLLCYFLEVKDRNNGNILIDDNGHIIHIDFGFLLSHSPGNMNFEKAPFKFTNDFLDLIEGIDSKYFSQFEELFYKGFLALRKNWATILSFIDLYIMSNSDLPCFYNAEFISESIKKKFLLEIKEEEQLKECVKGIILYALDNWRTNMYDNFQKYCVGVN